MIYPSISELTNNNQINRYTLVVATAKAARIITEEYEKQREYAEKLALSKDSDKKTNIASLIKKEYRDDKAVKTAISGIHNAEFKLIDLEGEETVLGTRREEGEADAEAAAAARDKIDNYSLDANTAAKKAD